MAKTKVKQTIQRKKVAFSLETAEAKEVVLAGDFNNWDPKAHPMKTDGNGIWNRTLMLSPGKYEYKFLIDGNWMEDPRNDQECTNCFGTRNSVLNLTG
ncbi:MAG: isoamylase early set domain-containing protein [Proteobacteria bacterium]|nr:isoamylase early set domain-containing protein [Pseudomonadota bacterium]